MRHLQWEPGKRLISIQNSPGALFPLARCDSVALEGRNLCAANASGSHLSSPVLPVSLWMLPLSQGVCGPPGAVEPWDLTLHCFTRPKSHSQQASWNCGHSLKWCRFLDCSGSAHGKEELCDLMRGDYCFFSHSFCQLQLWGAENAFLNWNCMFFREKIYNKTTLLSTFNSTQFKVQNRLCCSFNKNTE